MDKGNLPFWNADEVNERTNDDEWIKAEGSRLESLIRNLGTQSQIFAHLTLGVTTYASTYFKTFLTYLHRHTKGKVFYVAALEVGNAGDRPHYHTILAGNEMLTPALIKKVWRKGLVLGAAPFMWNGGGAEYLSKTVTNDECSLMDNLTPARTRRGRYKR